MILTPPEPVFEIISLVNQKFANKNSSNLFAFIDDCVKSRGLNFETYDIVVDVLSSTNAEIEKHSDFIIENAATLFVDNYSVLSCLFATIVLKQTISQFQKFINPCSLSSKSLAEIIYDDNFSGLEHLVNFPDESWETTMQIYAEYLDKLCVAMSMFKDEKYINPTWIDFIVEQIKDKDEIDARLAKSLKDYFKMLDLSRRFKENDWQEWQLKTLAKFGVLKIMYLTTT